MKAILSISRLLAIATVIVIVNLPMRSSAQFFTGGDLGVTFVGGFNAELAPVIGYRYKNFSVALSPVVLYTATGNTTGTFSYGARVYAEYSFYKGLFAHAEVGALNTGYIDWPADGSAGIFKRNWVLSAPIGLGYEKEITSGVYFRTMILYDPLLDLNLNQSSPLANPQIRAGFTYSF